MLSKPFQSLRNGYVPNGFFHWRDGWYFGRAQNGDVHVIKETSNVDLHIPAAEWCSIVHAVAQPGADYSAFEAYHAAPKPKRKARKRTRASTPAIDTEQGGGVE